MVRHFQEYVEPDDQMPQSMTASMRRVNPTKTEEDKALLPLGESTLNNNLGVPIIVVVTKVSRRYPGKRLSRNDLSGDPKYDSP